MRPIGPRTAPTLTPPNWRWLAACIWWIEHAFERARADQRPEEETRVRIFLMLAVFGVLFCALAVGATWAALGTEAGGRSSGGGAAMLARGDLTDRDGRMLAGNIRHYGLYIDPHEVWDRDATLAAMRAALPRLPEQRLRDVIHGDRYAVVQTGLTPAERAAVHQLGLGGVYFQNENARVYPLGASASHVTGFAPDRGVSGAELAFDRELRAAGATGGAVALSIDLRVQAALENELHAAAAALNAAGAVGLVTDIHTGEVLAMSSYPAYDLNRRGATVNGVMNRTVAARYEMGSVFKAFTVAAGLDTGRADMNTPFDATGPLHMDGGRVIRDHSAQNRVMTLEEVFIRSSNIGTTRLAIDLGPEVMERYFRNLGLLDAAPIELKESIDPRLPPDWSNDTLASLSFGYAIMVSPIQYAAAMGALLNGGTYVPPSLRVGGATDGERRRVVSRATSESILTLMRANVLRGSGRSADAPGLRVGGKTGSADKVVNGQYDSRRGIGSFAAVFPSDGPLDTPRYLVFILMDDPQGPSRLGGAVAAPVAGRVIDRIAGFLDVERVHAPPAGAAQ